MRFSVAQLIVFVTLAAFLIAFGGFFLTMLERFFIPISVFGFLVFLNWSRMFSGKNVLLTLAISLPALLVWVYMLFAYYRIISLGNVDSMATLDPSFPQNFPHPDALLKVRLEDWRLGETKPHDMASIVFSVIGLIGLGAACLAGWFLGSLIRRKSHK